MATGETRTITGNLNLTDKYQLTDYDDTLTVNNANITFLDPAGEIFLDAGNDTVTVTNSTITSSSASGSSLAFYLGSGDDSLTLNNSTLDTEFYAGSGNDSVTVTGTATSQVTVSKKFSLGAGNDTLTLSGILAGTGALDFGDGVDTLVFNGGTLKVTGEMSNLENLTVNAAGGTIHKSISLAPGANRVVLKGNLAGSDNNRQIIFWNSGSTRGSVDLEIANNVTTNVGLWFKIRDCVQTGSGTLTINGMSNNTAIIGGSSNLTLHDLVLTGNKKGISAGACTLNLTKCDISNNQIGIELLSTTSLTGADMSFTGNTNHAIHAQDGGVVTIDKATFRNNTTTSSATASTSEFATPITTAFSHKENVGGQQFIYYTYHSIASATVAAVTAAKSVGGAIYQSGGSMILTSTYFGGNQAIASARSIALASATASTITGGAHAYAGRGIAHANAAASASADGGAIYRTGSGLLTMSGATFSGNIAAAIANALPTADVKANHSEDTDAYATATASSLTHGGAFFNDYGDIDLTGADFSSNIASAQADAHAVATANGSSLVSASAYASAYAMGGAIYHALGTISLTQTKFSGNHVNVLATAHATAGLVASVTAIASGKGGAIAATSSIVNLTDVSFTSNYVSATATSGSSNGNSWAAGGALHLLSATLNYSVTSGKSISNTGNAATSGGFIYLQNSTATFDVAGTLTVGDANGKDSIAGDSASTITKLGSGTWTINSDITQYAGTWNVAAGKLKLERIARTITLDNWTIGADAELHLSSGNDTVNMGQDKKIGTINLGGGSDTINTGGYRLSGGKLLVSTLTLTGGGTVASDIFVRSSGFAFDLRLNNVTVESNLTGGSAADKLTVTQTSRLNGTIDLGAGNNSVTASSGTTTTFGGAFTVGGGNDTLSFAAVKFEKDVALGGGSNTLTATGAAEFSGTLTSLDGNDTLSFAGVKFSQDVSLGGGTNALTATGSAGFAGFSGGSGNDTLTLQNATFSGSVNLGGGTNRIAAAAATFSRGIIGGGGSDTITLTGNSVVSGRISLGGGKNLLSTTKQLTVGDGFDLNASGETRLLVYNGASLTGNKVKLYSDSGAVNVSVTLNWSSIADLDKVRILVSSDCTFKTYEFAVELYNQTKSFTLDLPEDYFIQFQAQDEDGWSQRLLPDTTAPGQVTGLAVSGGADAVSVSWEPTHDNLGGNGVKQYRVQLATDAGFSDIISEKTVSVTNCAFDKVTGVYYVRAQAEDYTGNVGAWSEPAMALGDEDIHVSAGQTVTGISVCSGARMFVSSGGTATSASITSGGEVHVYDRGRADNTTIYPDGKLYLSGGTANSTVLNGASGYLFLFSGGVANSTTITHGGEFEIYAGGTADRTTVNNGLMRLFGSCTANDTTVNSGGRLYISGGAAANGTVVNDGGNFHVYNRAAANGTIANSGGNCQIFSGATANDTTLNGSGRIWIYDGGTANSTLVNASCRMWVSQGGTANDTVVDGTSSIMWVSSSVANRTAVSDNGSVYVRHGVVNETTVGDFGYLEVSANGVANGVEVNASGSMCVQSGGKVTGGLTVANGATVSAYAGSILDFDVSTVAAGDAARVNDLSLVQGTPDFTITVAAMQEDGTYKLADGAADFVSTVTVTVAGATLGTLAVGGTLTNGGYTYRLTKDYGTLLLSVEGGVTPPIPGAFTPGDLNGDGRADIVMTIAQDGHGADGSTGAWLIQADQTAAWGDLSQRNAGWSIFGTGFTAAGKTTNDVYVKSADNVIGAWTTDADGKVTGWQTVGEFSADTQVLGLGDFDGDGQSDLLLRNTNGAVGCHFTNGRGWNYFQSLGDEWTVCAVGDLNGDGRDDVVLKHDAGFAGSWLTQSDYTMAWANLDTLAEGFSIVGTGDFDGDGTDDVLLKNGSYYGAWIVNDGSVSSWMGLGGLGSVSVEQIADFDADGIDDLRIRTAAGDLGAQLVKGADTLQWKYYGSVGPEWSTSLAAI